MTQRLRSSIIGLLLVGGLAGCSNPGSSADTYTLYRSSLVTGIKRVHVGSFDATDGDEYNRENCQLAAQLFQGQAGVQAKFWCEKGAYHQ